MGTEEDERLLFLCSFFVPEAGGNPPRTQSHGKQQLLGCLEVQVGAWLLFPPVSAHLCPLETRHKPLGSSQRRLPGAKQFLVEGDNQAGSSPLGQRRNLMQLPSPRQPPRGDAAGRCGATGCIQAAQPPAPAPARRLPPLLLPSPGTAQGTEVPARLSPPCLGPGGGLQPPQDGDGSYGGCAGLQTEPGALHLPASARGGPGLYLFTRCRGRKGNWQEARLQMGFLGSGKLARLQPGTVLVSNWKHPAVTKLHSGEELVLQSRRRAAKPARGGRSAAGAAAGG